MSSPDAAAHRPLRWLHGVVAVVLVGAAIHAWNGDTRPSPLEDRPAPEAFVAAYGIDAPTDAVFFQFPLVPEVYHDLSSRSAQDLAVVDAEGRALPVRLRTPIRPGKPTTVSMPLPAAHPVPAAEDASAKEAWRMALIQPSGAVPNMAIGTTAPDAPPVWVVDARSTAAGGVDGIRLSVAPGEDVALRLRVEASDDLLDWRTLADERPILRLGAGATSIEQREIGWPKQHAGWLRLSVVAGRWPEALGPPAIEALRRDVDPEVLPEWVESAVRVVEPGRRYAFDGPGALPAESVAVRLAPPAGAAGFRLVATGEAPERQIASGTAWRVDIGGAAIGNPTVGIDASPMGPLDLVLDSSSAAPQLAWSYRPAMVQVMASGRPPYRLLVGHAGPTRPIADLEPPLAAYRAQSGGTELPEARLGPRAVTGGAAARAPAKNGRVVLWALLAAGALGLGLMAWQQLRGPPST